MVSTNKRICVTYYIRSKNFFFIAPLLMICLYSFGQGRKAELILDLNTPASIQLEPFPYSNPMGVSISYKKPIKNNLSIGALLSYDNFKYKTTGKRTGDFIQARIGLTKNDLVKLYSELTSYFVIEMGAVYKAQTRLTTNSMAFSFASGLGLKQRISTNSFINFLTLASNIHEPNFSDSWCIDFKIGWGFYLGH